MNSNRKRMFDQHEIDAFTIKSPFHAIPTVEEFLLYWLDEVVHVEMKANTYTNYRSIILKHVIPTMGDYTLDMINANVLHIYMKIKMAKGRLDGTGGLSAKSVIDQMAMLKQAYKVAVAFNLVEHNPCHDIQLPKIERKEMDVLSVEQQEKVNDAISSDWKPNSHFGVYLANRLGLRIGEVSALRINDFDEKDRTLMIDETLSRVAVKHGDQVKYELVFGTTKSKRTRILPLSDDVYHMMVNFIHTMPNAYKKDSNALIFINPQGKPMEPKYMNYHFHKLMKKLKIQGYHFHSLRHTFATRSIELGMQMKAISFYMGHASTAITEAIYVHATERLLMNEITRTYNQVKMSISA